MGKKINLQNQIKSITFVTNIINNVGNGTRGSWGGGKRGGALREKGDIIYAVTARGQFSGVETDIAKKKLRQAGIKFDTVFWYQCDKLDIAKKLKLDVMIDDRIDICTAFAENGITALNFYMAGRKMPEESEKLRVVYNWGEVYRAIEHEREKKNKK